MSNLFSSVPKSDATQSQSQVKNIQTRLTPASSGLQADKQGTQAPKTQNSNVLRQDVPNPNKLNKTHRASPNHQGNVKLTPPTAQIQSLALIPATIQFSSKSDRLCVDASQYLVVFSSIKKRRVAAAASSYQLVDNPKTVALQAAMASDKARANVNVATTGSTTSDNRQIVMSEHESSQNQISSRLLALGKSVSIALPATLQQRLNQQGLDLQQMKALSSRAQGYPLPMTQINNNKLLFSNGTCAPLTNITVAEIAHNAQSNDVKSQPLSVIPSIHYQNPRWILALTPVIDELQVRLTPDTSTMPIPPFKGEQILVAKPEIGNIYTQLFKTLSQASMDNFQAPKSSHVRTQSSDAEIEQTSQQHTMQTSIQRAYGKFSGTPPGSEPTAKMENSLLANLTKLLPQLRPLSLNALALPSTIKDELSAIANLPTQANPQSMSANSLSHIGSISLLFQLLLGVKANNASGHTGKISETAQKYLQKLQAQFGSSTSLLSLLDKAGSTETLGKLLSNLTLYSQASNDTGAQLNWYFTLPYSLNQHQQELEGHFSKEKEEDDENSQINSWRLQLKFDLTKGPLLIQAQVKDNRINMTFNGSNDTFLKKIDALLPPLINKLTDIGFTPESVNTKLTKVPATLLPGEHFLVKIKA